MTVVHRGRSAIGTAIELSKTIDLLQYSLALMRAAEADEDDEKHGTKTNTGGTYQAMPILQW